MASEIVLEELEVLATPTVYPQLLIFLLNRFWILYIPQNSIVRLIGHHSDFDRSTEVLLKEYLLLDTQADIAISNLLRTTELPRQKQTELDTYLERFRIIPIGTNFKVELAKQKVKARSSKKRKSREDEESTSANASAGRTGTAGKEPA